MVFEKVSKGGHFHSFILPRQISISKHTLIFGREIAKTFDKGFVEVYLDKKKSLVGFSSSNSPLTGYKMHKSNNVTGIFARELKKGLYEANLESGIWVIKVDKIPENIPTIKKNE